MPSRTGANSPGDKWGSKRVGGQRGGAGFRDWQKSTSKGAPAIISDVSTPVHDGKQNSALGRCT